MSHDLYASWVTAELSALFKINTEILFEGLGITSPEITSFANKESGRVWPIPDGRISIDVKKVKIEIGLELKRTNEGLHGVLTAIGQSQAYLKKGYDISVIAVPDKYDSYSTPGKYIKDLLQLMDKDSNIVVVTYSPPDLTKASPFHDKLTIHRKISFDPALAPKNKVREFSSERSSNQWAHLREGSSDAHCFFKYLQTAKNVSAAENYQERLYVNPSLETACTTINPNISSVKFLSNAPADSLHDMIWRKFWLDYVITEDMQTIWKLTKGGIKEPINFKSKLKSDPNTYKEFFGGRVDSTKNKLVKALNSANSVTEIIKTSNTKTQDKLKQLDKDKAIDLKTITAEDLSWIVFAINIHHRAHSLREDIDSGLSHIGMLDDDGRPSESGYRFTDLSERTGDCYSGKPFLLYGKAILGEGQWASLLHYIHRISDDKLASNPLLFSSNKIVKGKIKFESQDYLKYVRTVMIDDLCVINTAKSRGGKARKPFQAEFAILQKLGIIAPKANRFRLGYGLIINWPKLNDYLEDI
jgi:hypothetical protein